MQFSKMHGLGNDFVVIDGITQNVILTAESVRYLSNRYYGIGFDQLLIVESSKNPKVDFYYRIFNADGREVNQCGNGVRCFAYFVRMKKLTCKRIIRVSTRVKCMTIFVIEDDYIRVNMGEPDFRPEQIPFKSLRVANSYVLYIAEKEKSVRCSVVSIGNPHCVIIVKDVDIVEVGSFGLLLSKHFSFPEEANVGFMQIINCAYIRLRVYERGVGETRSCGSAACAAVAVGVKQGLLSERVKVELLGGSLWVDWKGSGHDLYMSGPATHVYDGYINF
ncbi:diaminopimelate epimerase [Blochmannia endosymbiont of Camponotus (Colobopsis) obliquus]|uniref:diaminopimelate epimerase n=1 Tax=Blochmannia endosymbiont of Camponotus (Colobopsis) obliquus TaxID=1505597 RepID=UPI00061A83AD|nr:diaminopimelate epimerase [Blochmannia endosymbiont of Camponotus (Colobopsis) obliquus]AKC60724.1 diaminopimelate epimerase [Blochmannia endosymbiont of Camponotus (Colobopsis) obliquus]